MEKCQACLAPIFYARLKAGGNRISLDVRPLLEGDIVISQDTDGHDYLWAVVTTGRDPEAIYKRHVCQRKRPT
jgi:hypothetical protein